MSKMEKQGVGARTGGFMQTRRGTRPLHVETLLRKKTPESASNYFEPQGPTDTDKTFEQSLAATAGEEFQPPPEQEKDAELRRDTVQDKPTQVDPGLIESVKIRPVGELRGKKVVLVDGGKIRDKIDTDFALGGNSARYSYVPEGELWVENTGNEKDVANTAIHEGREEGLMRRGQTYNEAHGTATEEETERRKQASIGEILGKLTPVADDAALIAYRALSGKKGKKQEVQAPKVKKAAEKCEFCDQPATKMFLRQPMGFPICNSSECRRKAEAAGDEAGADRHTIIRKLAAVTPTGTGEFAPGIPIGRVVKKIPSVKEKGPNAEWTASLSLHPAARRGDHLDLRLVDPQGKAHSWAIQNMPVPGGSTYAAQQPTHSGSYARRTEPFSIPAGVYGATRPGAQVESKYVQPVEIISANDKRVHLLRHSGQETEELVLRRVAEAGDRTPIWALHNATRTRETQEGKRLPNSKPRYQDIPIGSVDLNNDQQLMTAKIDGAHTLVDFPKADRMVRTYSYRPTQRQSGLIEHTFKFPGFHEMKTPPSLKGTLIRAETWASDPEGKAIPASEIGGLLNSSVPKSREKQQEGGLALRRTGIDVVRFRGKDVSNAPYAQKLEMLREVNKATKGAIELPIAAYTPEEKASLLGAVKAGQLPETKEGVVLHDLGSSTMMKAKVRPSTSVYVREILTKPKTEAKGQAAGFRYSLEPTGPVVGHVGTGFSQQMRKEMLQNPDQFIGRVAKVQSGGQHVSRSGKSGALIGSPAFKEWHIDKTPPELMKEGSDPLEQLEREADPEKLVGRLVETRTGRALVKPMLQSAPVRPVASRIKAIYHRLIGGESRG